MSEIRPSSDLRNKYKEISSICKEKKKPVFITVNGRGDTVLLDIEEYEKMQEELEMYKILAEAEEDIENNRVYPIENLFTKIEKRFKKKQ